MDLPGYKEAEDLGYSLSYHGGDHQSATYTKEGICLTVRYKGSGLEACLEFVWKLLLVKSLSFTLPNKNFEILESQITVAKDRLGEGD